MKKTDRKPSDLYQSNKYDKNGNDQNVHQTNRSSTFYFKQHARNVNTVSWLKFFIILYIILVIGVGISYLFKSAIPLIILFILSMITLSVRLKRLKRIQFLNQLKMPQYIWDAFKKRHPSISVVSNAQIEEGFKDYLAIHLWRKGNYAMPSHAVDALWHLLIEEYELYYKWMCQHALG